MLDKELEELDMEEEKDIIIEEDEDNNDDIVKMVMRKFNASAKIKNSPSFFT